MYRRDQILLSILNQVLATYHSAGVCVGLSVCVPVCLCVCLCVCMCVLCFVSVCDVCMHNIFLCIKKL